VINFNAPRLNGVSFLVQHKPPCCLDNKT